MRLDSPADLAAALRATEIALGVRYPPAAPRLLAELSTIVGTPQHHALFARARVLVTADDVSAPRDELGGQLINGYLLPFLSDERGKRPDIYGFDMTDPKLDRIAVFSVHTIVESWATPAAFLHWVRTFTPRDRLPP